MSRGNVKIGITALVSLAAVVVSGAQVLVAHMNQRAQMHAAALQRARDVVSEAARGLGAVRGDEIDLQTRLAAITSLRLLALEGLPSQYDRVGVELLATYVGMNLPDRKRDAPGVRNDRGRFRSEDIRLAIVAAQDLRRAGMARGEHVDVRLRALDFSWMDLSDLDLTGFDFEHSKLHCAFLTRAIMTDTDFSFADMQGVVIWNADHMAGARFFKANLQGARLSGGDVRGSTIEQASEREMILFNPDEASDDQMQIFRKAGGAAVPDPCASPP